MRKYYTRPCNLYYGKSAIELINNNTIKKRLGYLFSFEVERTTGWAKISRESMIDFQSRMETVYFSDYDLGDIYINSEKAHNLAYKDQWTLNWFYRKKHVLNNQRFASYDFDKVQKEILILIKNELDV